MKAIIDTNNTIKVIASEITVNNGSYQVTNDILDTVPEYGLKFNQGTETSVMTLPEGVAIPADYASDKYFFINGEFVLNPDYVEPSFN